MSVDVAGVRLPPARRDALSRWLPIGIITGLVLAQGAIGIGLLMGEHGDSREILYHSVPAILSGHYHRSRALGTPLYEFVAAGLMALGGIKLVNAWSLLLSVASMLLFDRLIGRGPVGQRTTPPGLLRTLVLAGFALNPIFLTNSTTPIDWMQGVFLELCLILAAWRYTERPEALGAVLFALASLANVLTRPDLVWVCVSVFLAVTWTLRHRWMAIVRLAAASSIAAALAAMVYLSLNDMHELSTAVTFDGGTLPRRIALAIGGIFALFGIPGVAAAGVCAGAMVRMGWRGHGRLSFAGTLFLVAAPILVVRFIILPAKVDYLFPFLVILLLAIASEVRSLPAVALLVASLVFGSVIQISFLERKGQSDALSFAIHVNDGALPQDWERRRQFVAALDPAFLDALAREVYAGEPGPVPTLRSVKFFPGLISDREDLVIGAPELYRLDNPRFTDSSDSGSFGVPDLKRSAFKRVFVCDRSVMLAGLGWRSLQRPVSIAHQDPATGRVDTICRPES